MNYELISPRIADSAIAQVLLNRGMSQDEIKHYLSTTNNDILPPVLLDNMREGAKMLMSHISAGHKIYVQVDCDVDGLTSSALLLNYLYSIFPSYVLNNISYGLHEDKAHGIDVKAFDADQIALVIAPDSSSNEFDLHKSLKAEGIDVLVLDHHEAEMVSQYACVINNQLCNYPTKSLSGVGIVYKFCCYLDSLLAGSYYPRGLDLVALGMVADMMDLRDCETKHLIGLGMEHLTNPFMKSMVVMQDYSLGGQLTPEGIAFYIAPYGNAVMRSGTMEEKILLFESMLDFKAYDKIPSTKRGHKGEFETRVEQACRTCANVKNRQAAARDRSVEIIENIIERENLLDNKIILAVFPQEVSINRSLNGLIANQLMSKYQRPVMILTETEHDGVKWYEGSARNYDKADLGSLRELVLSFAGTEYAEGHASAFGFGITAARKDEFVSWMNEQLKDCDFTPKYNVDFIYDYKDINYSDIVEIAQYKKLWGQKLEEPLIVIENLPVTKDNLALMKRNTVKITLDNISFITFNNEEFYNDVYTEMGCNYINLVGVCSINSWDNKPQIKLVDYEIIRKQSYYF